MAKTIDVVILKFGEIYPTGNRQINAQTTPYDSSWISKFKLGCPNGCVKYSMGGLKSAIFDQYLLYISNGAKYGHSYYGRLIIIPMRLIEWRCFHTLSGP